MTPNALSELSALLPFSSATAVWHRCELWSLGKWHSGCVSLPMGGCWHQMKCHHVGNPVEEPYPAVLMWCSRSKEYREAPVNYVDLMNSLLGFPQSGVHCSLDSAVVFWRGGKGMRGAHSWDKPCNCWGFRPALVWCTFPSLRWSGVHLWVYLKLDMRRMLQSCCHLVCAWKEVP